ncbi:hypothetical protein [Pseudanabaena sp. 'Roaring Creek']|uniref:hypothetical protein n=1 Tax=Pseudanabaena sp. 'Roaring Creek' TaxID=1681830 RepID=UPI0006D83F4B|nr:hypothetical protein [Pseudanabaena sp. 'Roaring Creek']
MSEFLINHRSRALLDLVDAFNLTESELQDLWDGLYNRIYEMAEINKESEPAKPVGFDDPMMSVCNRCNGEGYIEMLDEEFDVECPECKGTGESITNVDLSGLLNDLVEDIVPLL